MIEIGKIRFHMHKWYYKWRWYEIKLPNDVSSKLMIASHNQQSLLQVHKDILFQYRLNELSKNEYVYFEIYRKLIRSIWFSDASDFTLYMMLRE